jgi:hypothetical protein
MRISLSHDSTSHEGIGRRVLVFFVLTRNASMPGGIVMAALAILPPILLWFWWNDPEPTMSESIHEVRDSVSRAPVRRD